MTKEERSDAYNPLFTIHDQILQADGTVIGFNIGTNCG